jgi:hypothetical protein
MQVEEFLSLLKGVRGAGNGRWIARCPHHNDRSPSLSITKGDRVPILLHCFAGCDPDQIVAAVGLELSDLMPDKDPNFNDGERARVAVPFTCEQAMHCLETEATFLYVVASDMAAGKPLDSLTKDRIVDAGARIIEACRLCDV